MKENTQAISKSDAGGNAAIRAVGSFLCARPAAALGFFIVAVVVSAALFAPWVAPHDPRDQDLIRRLHPPAHAEGSLDGYLLGTDSMGRDVLSRLVYGARISIVVGVASVAISSSLGVMLGILSGYFGGRLDDVIMRLADVQLAFPFLLAAISVLFVLGNGLDKVVLVIGVVGWTTYGRVVRGQVMAIKEKGFVEAARAVGGSDVWVMLRHIVPNLMSSVIVVATLQIARVIIVQAALSFLGLGVDPRIPTWGGMLAEGREYLNTHWWVAVFPGLAIMFTVLGINLLGDWARDTLDPHAGGGM